MRASDESYYHLYIRARMSLAIIARQRPSKRNMAAVFKRCRKEARRILKLHANRSEWDRRLAL